MLQGKHTIVSSPGEDNIFLVKNLVMLSGLMLLTLKAVTINLKEEWVGRCLWNNLLHRRYDYPTQMVIQFSGLISIYTESRFGEITYIWIWHRK